MSLTPEQLAARKHGMGGGDAAACAGLSPYKGPLQLFYQKTGELEPDQTETEAMVWGTRLEPIVATVYAEKTGRKIRRQPQRVHPEYPWMRGNVDRQIIGDKRGPGILEVKTTNTFSAKDWEHGPPDAALLQLQHYLAIYGYQWGSIVALIGGQQFKYFDVERDNDLIDDLITIEAAFWLRVQERRPPDTQWDKESLGILRRLFPHDSGKVIELPADYADHIHYYLAAKENIDNFNDQKARHEGAIKAFMQDASLATLPGYSISWKQTKAGTKFDEDRFKEECPDIYAQYQTVRPGYRRFQVRPSKEVSCLPKKSPSETISLPEPDSPTPDPPSA